MVIGIRASIVATLMLLAVSASRAAAAMSVDEFLARASALEKKGVTALFSSEFKLLQGEVKNAGVAMRASQKAALAAGRKPAACLPDKVPVKSDELLAYFRAIPQPQRGISVATAFGQLMRKKYPCPA